VHQADAVAGEQLRIAVGLELELTELGGEVRVLQPLEHGHHAARGTPAIVEQEHLLLRADPPDVRLEQLVLEHVLQRTHVIEQRGHELALLLTLETPVDVLVFPRAHPRVHSPRICGIMARHVNQSCGY
jgi:hypothetical protein